MITEIYVSTNGLDYKKLDLLQNESILFKYVYKDTQDLTKIYSPFSQSFALQGSLNNLKALDFIGNTAVQRNKSNNFDCKLFINGILSKQGILKITEIREENGKAKSMTANFTNNLLDLKTRMGETLVNELPINAVKVSWVSPVTYTRSIRSVISDGVEIKYFSPLCSKYRIWQCTDPSNTNALNNITYVLNNKDLTKGINPNELIPAINFKSIVDLIKKKYSLNIEMPIESELWYNDLFVLCNKLNEEKQSAYFDIINNFGGYNRGAQHFHKYDVSVDYFKNEFTFKRFFPQHVGIRSFGYLNFGIKFNNIINLSENKDVELDCILENLTGEELSRQKITSNNGFAQCNFVIDKFDNNNEFKCKLRIETNQLIRWTSSNVAISFDYDAGFFGKGTLYKESLNNNNSQTMPLFSIDLFKSLPNLKVIDFFTSFLKTLNISIFEAGADSDKLYFLTPKDIKAENKFYSKTEVDYTAYLNTENVNKKITNDYNFYVLKHKTNKYLQDENFGNLQYPEIKPTQDLNEFKIETNFAIPKKFIVGASNIYTFYLFTNESTKDDSGFVSYKPNEEDFTLFFMNGIKPLAPWVNSFVKTSVSDFLVNFPITRAVAISSIHESTGFSLGFELIEEATQESLYENFYKEQIERLLDPNSLQHTFTLTLPPNELVQVLENNNQGQSNIPSGFRLQNDVIIKEKRYSIIDATIDQTTGKTTLTLLNYT